MSWQIWTHCMCVVIDKNKVPTGPNNAGHTHRAGDSLLRSTGFGKMFGDSGLLSAEQDFPVEHCSQKWKSTVVSSTEEWQWKDTLWCSRKVVLIE